MEIVFYRNFITRQWRWRVKAKNGKIIGASSEGFWNKEDCIYNAKILGEALIYFK